MNKIQQRKLTREDAILSSLNKLDYLSRSQIQRLHDLGGDRNARRILNNMSGLVSSFRGDTGESIFYLSKAGRERIGCDIVRQKTNQVNHFLMRADAYIHFKPEDWKNEARVIVKDVVTIIPDAYFRYELKRHFLEIDHLQHMSKNKEKIERYKKLRDTGTFQERLKYFPRLIWVTTTENRKKQLTEWCNGLDVVVYLWSDIK